MVAELPVGKMMRRWIDQDICNHRALAAGGVDFERHRLGTIHNSFTLENKAACVIFGWYQTSVEIL
jgi:hypothetical protein